jgi:hypothetical protein
LASLTLTPTYPIPSEQVSVAFAGLAATTNFVRAFVTAAPKGSELYKRLQTETKERIQVHAGPSDKPWLLTPDVGGVYTYTLEEYQRIDPSAGMFQDDPGGAPSPTVTASGSVTLRIGQKLKHRLGTDRDSAELQVYVWADTVRPTTLEVHGEVTPAIVNPSSPAAEAAIEASAVVTAVDALTNQTATTIVGSEATVFASLRDAYQAHVANATFHNAADATNTIGDGYVATSPKASEASINELRRQLRAHMANTVASSATAPHDNPDGTNAFVTPGASSDPVSRIAALVDTWIVYSGHIATASPVHNSADGPNTAPPLSFLMTVHRRFFEALANTSPAAPAATNSAVTTLAQLAGFKEA